mmetsp:Transcript_22121/g.53601  ORF Transcript_22121/g.53601 Transcript_22121/m.53601 type:complete len:188 (-) Transcript_22121:1239-1802(-)
MCEQGLDAMLLRHAIKDSTTFFSKIGFNPKYPPALEFNICPDFKSLVSVNEKGGVFHAGALICTDLVWFHVITFVAHLAKEIRGRGRLRSQSQKKSHCIKNLAESLSLSTFTITALQDHIEQHTREGLESVDLRRPHDANNDQEPIVGLIATEQFTHRICLYTKVPEEASENMNVVIAVALFLLGKT